MARLYQAEVRYAARNGLHRDYQHREEQLATVRGRIDVGAQISRFQDRRLPLECRYQDFTEDSDLNRVLKAAHRRLLRLPGLGPEVLRDLRGSLRLFNEVREVPYSSATVPDLQFNRLNEEWRAAGHLAEMILRQDSVRDVTGSVNALSFTVDMNKVYERFIEAVVHRAAREAGFVFEAQARRRLTARVAMKPDLVLRYAGRDVAVGDAKYKGSPRRIGRTPTSTSCWLIAMLSNCHGDCSSMRTPVVLAASSLKAPMSPWRSLGSSSLGIIVRYSPTLEPPPRS